MLVDVRVRAPAGDLGDLAVGETRDAEREVAALSRRQLGQALERAARLDRLDDRDAAGDDRAPALAVVDVLEVRDTVDTAEAVRLVDGDYLPSVRHTKGLGPP